VEVDVSQNLVSEFPVMEAGVILDSSTQLGDGSCVGNYAVIGACEIGDNVTIGHHVIISDNVTIGDNVIIEDGCILCYGLTVGDDVYIGPGVVFLQDRYPPRNNPDVWEPPVIDSGAIINGGVTVCPCIKIGVGAKVAGGAVVTKRVDPNTFVAGVPAKIWGSGRSRGKG
jgi:acetyltransferase-like isoleucine patch superfamily enzyme